MSPLGLFKKRQPAPVRQAFCAVDDTGRAYVHQQHHANMPPEAIALLASVTFLLDVAIESFSKDPAAFPLWMSFAAEAWDPESVNMTQNPSGVHHLDPMKLADSELAAARGAFTLLPTSKLAGT